VRTRAAAEDDPPGAVEIVAEVGKRCVGSVVCWRESANIFYCTRLFVQPEFRRRGIGRSLIMACEEHARAHNATIRVSVAESNLGGRAFFGALGFTL
jgi:ribosomal protein S18 acetylase RimI-like enzyme